LAQASSWCQAPTPAVRWRVHIGSDRVLGAILTGTTSTTARREAEIRLLSTVATAMGVALQSALRFAETQRLLRETEARNAELAVINSIQQAVGAELDFQAIVDTVGDKLREVFATGDIAIRWWDEATRMDTRLYCYEHGVRLDVPPSVAPADGLVARYYRERRVWLFNSLAEQAELGMTALPGTDQARSIVSVPMMAGERIFGAVVLEDHERDNAFGPAEVRLLETSPPAWPWRCSTPGATRPSASARPSWR
jgi:GAF domain-containing protein